MVAASVIAVDSSGGTSGFVARCWSANELVMPPSRIAPMSAVPSDAPRFWAVPWSPPAWFVCVRVDATT